MGRFFFAYAVPALVLALTLDIPALHAQSSGQDPLAKRTELLEWKAMMLENKYLVEKSEKNRRMMIASAEELATLLCLREMPEQLEYKGPGENQKCREWIEKVLSYDDSSPYGLCARDGIDSGSCRSSYDKVVPWADDSLVTVRSGAATGSGGARLGRFSGTRVPQMAAAGKGVFNSDRELNDLHKKYEQENTDSLKYAIFSRYRELLGRYCADVNLELLTRAELKAGVRMEDVDQGEDKEDEPSGPKKAFVPDDSKLIDPEVLEKEEKLEKEKELDSLIARLDQLTKGQVPAEQSDLEEQLAADELLRVRRLPAGCSHQITYMLRVFPQASLALCSQNGLYSPQCVDALRRDEKQREEQQGFKRPARKQPRDQGPAFSTF